MSDKYLGMTVNERLYLSGLIKEFASAVEGKCTDDMVSILKRVELSNESVDPILENLGLDKPTDHSR